MTDSTARLRTYDLARGLAILGVVAVHAIQAYPTTINIVDLTFGLGKFGVQLFFYISALTMCHMWMQREGERNPFRKFYLRRFFRIAPLFWLAIPVYLLINGTSQSPSAPDGIGTRQIILTAFFLNSFSPSDINCVVPGGWTIAIEMVFYLIFPHLINVVRDRQKIYLLAAVMMWIINAFIFKPMATLFFSKFYEPTMVQEFLYMDIFNQAPIFLLGCYLFFAMKLAFRWSEVGIFGAWLVLGLVANGVDHVRDFNFLAIFMTLGVVIIFGTRFNVRFAWIELLGRQAYGMYLTHFLVLHYLHLLLLDSGLTNLIIGFSITILTSYLLSLALHYLVEKPVQSYIKAITQ